MHKRERGRGEGSEWRQGGEGGRGGGEESEGRQGVRRGGGRGGRE